MLARGFGRLGVLTVSLCARRSALCAGSMADQSRERMMNELTEGACASGDASEKVVLVRGCDPAMAQRAPQMLSPLLGNVKMVAVTTNDEFFSLLGERRYDVVSFAPGACRFSAARQTIPGGTAATKHWTLEEYKAKVRELQGEEVPIVETTEERQMVPLLRAALGLPPA